ncbi:MAG: helix-turn-helix domain-containing protein [Nitriliruptorales bacterium]|nr:helix-turn-helix domain-containing protein [Nitriliruptorales bacterium]
MSVARALGSETRAGIYAHLREAGDERTVRDVAGLFDLHPNVARTHLETLADAGLVRVGRRKHPGGGRPAKVYTAIPDAPDGTEPGPEGDSATGALRLRPQADPTLLVRLLAMLLDGPGIDARGRVVVAPPGRTTLAARAHETAAAEGRRLAGGLGDRGGAGRGRGRRGVVPVADAAALAVRALLPWAPELRVVKSGADWADITGLRPLFSPLIGLRPELAEVLERGLLMGVLAGAGVQVAVSEVGTLPGGGPVWRTRATSVTSARPRVEPAAGVDTRGQHREAGVVHAMRRITRLRAGEVLEVLAEGPGAPAAFARWADRAGHQLLGVERATDDTGRPAIRLLIRKGP